MSLNSLKNFGILNPLLHATFNRVTYVSRIFKCQTMINSFFAIITISYIILALGIQKCKARFHFEKIDIFYSILLCRARELACVLAQLENEKGREQQQQNQSAFLKESFSHFPSFFFQKLINMQNSSFAQWKHRLSKLRGCLESFG